LAQTASFVSVSPNLSINRRSNEALDLVRLLPFTATDAHQDYYKINAFHDASLISQTPNIRNSFAEFSIIHRDISGHSRASDTSNGFDAEIVMGRFCVGDAASIRLQALS
jgi:hypothetical protein